MPYGTGSRGGLTSRCRFGCSLVAVVRGGGGGAGVVVVVRG